MARKNQKFSYSLFFLLLFLATIAGLFIFSASINKFIKDNPRVPAACNSLTPLGTNSSFLAKETAALWLNQPVSPLAFELEASSDVQSLAQANVLGKSTQDKWIEIDLSTQTLKAHQDDQIISELPISSGKFATTPTGEYQVWYKSRYTQIEGGQEENSTNYYLPNIPYALFFHQGYGIVGSYWHTNFGQPASFGCVDIPIAGAQELFYWSEPFLPEGQDAIYSTAENPGTKVIVHGHTPTH